MNKEFYTQSFKEEVTAREIPIHTINLQLDSLVLFMAHLGYLFSPNKVKGLGGFYAPKGLVDLYKYYPKHISFQDAVRLHNGAPLREVHFRETSDAKGFVDIMAFKYKFHIPWSIYKEACDARLVHEVKLQKLKKAPFVKAQSHYVKLLENS
tara:strand:+ start:71928 stop:72383 length:456 start_codon:yes stop_codon:yes gene_type:complete